MSFIELLVWLIFIELLLYIISSIQQSNRVAIVNYFHYKDEGKQARNIK